MRRHLKKTKHKAEIPRLSELISVYNGREAVLRGVFTDEARRERARIQHERQHAQDRIGWWRRALAQLNAAER